MRQFRTIVVKNESYTLPPRLNRHSSSAGWNVSFKKKQKVFQRWFGDDDYGSTRNSYQAAMAYLSSKGFPTIYGLPTLREINPASKESELPVGISGPYWYLRKGSDYCVFKISIPTANGPSRIQSCYIGTVANWQKRHDDVLKKAVEIRNQAVQDYNEAAEKMRQVVVGQLDTKLLKSINQEFLDVDRKKVIDIHFKRLKSRQTSAKKLG